MISALFYQILVCALAFYALWILLRALFGIGSSGGRPVRQYHHSAGGFIGRGMYALVFSVMLPVMWWTVGLVFRMYRRAFVVFLEFMSGVADWPSYRTSIEKYLGVLFGFVGYNGIILCSVVGISLLIGGVPPPGWNQETELPFWAVPVFLVLATGFCLALARLFLRRMP